MAILLVVLCLASSAFANNNSLNSIPIGELLSGGRPGGSIPPGQVPTGPTTACPIYGIFQAPDPTSCSRFILCNNGIGRTHNCSEGTHFNIDRGICIDRAIANCDLCRFNTEPVLFLPYEGSCTRYIVCFGTNRVERECANGFYFNPRIGQCDRKQNVDCKPDEDHIPTVQCPISDQVEFLPSRHSCEGYFVCASGIPSFHNCSDGLIFDINTSLCATTGRCLLDYRPDCSTNAAFLPHVYDCRHYFFCNNEEPLLLSCAPGLLFDITSAQCNIDIHATCAPAPPEDENVWPGFYGQTQ